MMVVLQGEPGHRGPDGPPGKPGLDVSQTHSLEIYSMLLPTLSETLRILLFTFLS